VEHPDFEPTPKFSRTHPATECSDRSRTQDPASRQLDAAGPTGHDATPREFEEHVGGEEEAEANASRPHVGCRLDKQPLDKQPPDGHWLVGHWLDKHHE